MVGKRKRTRSELLEAVRVNATPAEPEAPGEKRKRKQRRAYAQRNLDKELAALAIAEPVVVVQGPTDQTPSVADVAVEPSTVEEEGKTEEDDPPERQRRFAAAYAEGQQTAETEQTVASSPPATDREAARRARNAERERARRANMSASQKELARQKNRERARAARARMGGNERRAVRDADRLRHQQRRANGTEDNRAASQATDRAYRSNVRVELTEEEREAYREENRVRRKAPQYGAALANQEDFRVSMVKGKNVVNGRHRLPPTIVCPSCNAWKWPDESAFICCMRGKVKLPPLHPAPPRLMELYRDREFRRHIRAYNQAFAFTSIGASASGKRFRDVNQDQAVAGQHGVYTYRIQGAMGHYLGSMLPYVDQRTGEQTAPKFAQIYILDPDMQQRARRRKNIFADLDNVALLDIETMMQTCNPLAQRFLSFGEKLREDIANGVQVQDIEYRLHPRTSQPGTHNLPTTSEVAAALIEDGNLAQPRDIRIFGKDHQPFRLWETHADYDPLQYPLLFPYGEPGWTFTDTYADGARHRKKRKMALREHTAYRLFQKADDQSALHQGGRLFQQFCVDERAKCEQEQLRWAAANQKAIRADLYHGLRDAYLSEDAVTLGDGEARLFEFNRESGTLVHPNGESRHDDFLGQIGKRIILPNSHVGGPRYMYNTFQDAMAIVREYGSPDGFLTSTCSPNWEEILEKIPDRIQTAQDRPDIVARAWHLKLKAQLKDLNEGILGRIKALMYVVEFQKRGLPHAHLLFIVDEVDKPRLRHRIDEWSSAEVPDKDVNPALFDTVIKCMIHGPCGAANPHSPCMKDGKCSKGYPKPLLEVTRANENGYPEYRRRRREPGVLNYKGKIYDNETINQWVVPYNPFLSQKYDSHINLEVCSSILAVKYLYKYITKGPDKAVMTVEAVRDPQEQRQEPNEVLRYLNARYISPVEGCMRLMAMEIQGKTHSVTTLTVHLEDCQMVTFCAADAPEDVLRRAERSMLTSFFDLCASDAPQNQIAKSMLYQEIPKKFSWNAADKVWIRRTRSQAAVGRLIHVSFRDKERYFLRVLLCHRKGPTSFSDLRTVGGVVLPSFEEAAKQLGFIDDDREWFRCMSEAVTFRMPYQLRQLFATLLVYANVSDVRALWDQFSSHLAEDFARKYRDLEGQTKEDMVMFQTLKSLNDLLQVSGASVQDYDLPQLGDYPDLVRDSLLENNLIRRELEGYDHGVLAEVDEHTDDLNQGQRDIYNQVMDAVENPVVGNKLFFIDGPGGTGKSTLLKHILASVRLSGKIAIAVASSGIASLLLMGGRTAHSTFKIPINLHAESTCSIKKQSKLKHLIKQASLIIWDEAPMTHRHAFEAVDRSLRDIMDIEDEPFGGKTFVLSGDFRQILPVVVRGTPAETIDACLKSSHLWPCFKQVHLTENMRVRAAHSESTATELAAFSEFLLQVGEGRHEVNPTLGSDFIKIPRDMLIDNPPEAIDENAVIAPDAVPIGLTRIIDAMYADVNNPEIATDEYFANRTILTTTNAWVHKINEAVGARLDGDAKEYLSVDAMEDDLNGNFFEQEVLHAVNINGVPPHKLTLKTGAPIMLMRNLNPDLGLCNGTRLRVVELRDHVIYAKIMTGERRGQDVLIPRIVFISDNDPRGDFPFRLKRKQFPVQTAFAMTINKAQGQTVHNLGLYLASPCFSHGQLYVALSRVTARSKIKVLIERPELEDDDGAYTANIVYRQIFEEA